jgi:hypothetical protein
VTELKEEVKVNVETAKTCLTSRYQKVCSELPVRREAMNAQIRMITTDLDMGNSTPDGCLIPTPNSLLSTIGIAGLESILSTPGHASISFGADENCALKSFVENLATELSVDYVPSALYIIDTGLNKNVLTKVDLR